MAIPHSATVILLSVEKTSVCLANFQLLCCFPHYENQSFCMSAIIPAYIPTTKPGRLQPHDSCVITNFSVKALRVCIAMLLTTISVCKLSYTYITLKTVQSCTNPHKFYSEVTVTMITVKYFWPQNSVVKELWFCCNWKFTLFCKKLNRTSILRMST